jgi:transcriptional regulator with XRE-family HTH domain
MTLRDLRRQSVMGQAEVVRAMGVTSATVSRWESGERFPTHAHIRKLAELYNVPATTVLEAAEATRQQWEEANKKQPTSAST